MKKLILIIFLTYPCFADRYFITVDISTKEQKSSYILKDGEKLLDQSNNATTIELPTKEEYELACKPISSEEKFESWKESPENLKIVDNAIDAKVAEVQHEQDIKDALDKLAEEELAKIEDANKIYEVIK